MDHNEALATIELDNDKGRGELFVRSGSIWCRESDGNEYDTTQGAGRIMTLVAARDTIAQCWGLPDWKLEWVRD